MRKSFTTFLLLTLIPAYALSWGEKGHLMINRMAITAAASQLPEFIVAGKNQLVYDAYAPDRWREEANTPLATAQAPDHFFDSELWGSFSTLPADRYAFMDQVAEKKVGLIKIGYLPYSILETYGKLRNAFRMWRAAKTPEDRDAARTDALVFAGILGHYVGDGSNPMHMSVQYDGWDPKANPKGYTTTRGLHSRFESLYVNQAIDIAAVQPKVKAPKRLTNVFTSVRDYLAEGFGQLEPLYEMEKAGEFNPDKPMAKGTDFIGTQMARAATMLGDLWYTAWVESAEPARPPANQ